MAGLVGVYSDRDITPIIFDSMVSIQHRGYHGFGLVADGYTISERGKFSSSQKFLEELPKKKPASAIAIVQRASNGLSQDDMQPFGTGGMDEFSVLVNGKPRNCSLGDVEIILRAHRGAGKRMPDAINGIYYELEGHSSLLVKEGDEIYASRNPNGYTTFYLFESEDSRTRGVSSEPCTPSFLSKSGYKFKLVRELKPGETTRLNDGENWEFDGETLTNGCAHEYTNYSHATSIVECNDSKKSIYEIRKSIGVELAKLHQPDIDTISCGEDRARSVSLGYAEQSHIPFEEIVIPDRYMNKLADVTPVISVVPNIVRNKSVGVIVNSIRTGETLRRLIKVLKFAEVKAITILSASVKPIEWQQWECDDSPIPSDQLLSDRLNGTSVENYYDIEYFGSNTKEALARAAGIPEERLCL